MLCTLFQVQEVDEDSGTAEVCYLKSYRKYWIQDLETSDEPLANMTKIDDPLVANPRRGYLVIPPEVCQYVESILLA